MPYPTKKILLFVATALLLTLGKAGYARNYDVEMIVFEHVRNTSVGSSSSYLYPVVTGARRIPVEATEANAPLQPLPRLRLTEDAEKIRQSGNHRLLYHGGWRQTDFSKESAPFMSIALGERRQVYVEPAGPDSNYQRAFKQPPLNLDQNMQPKNIYQLFGGVKVWVGRFLHFDTRLAYTPPNGNVSYKFESERRMRSRRMHYIDHSRVGILVKIFPVDEIAPN